MTTATKKKTMLTISLVCELAEDEYVEMITAVENSIKEAVQAVYEKHDMTSAQREELESWVEYYGVSLQPQRDIPS